MKKRSTTQSPDRNGSGQDWDAYWAHGFLTSCANAFRGNYEGAIRATWEDFFHSLGEDARILDIATGNGAVAFLAAVFARANGLRFSIHGIDKARINPAAAWQGDPDVPELIRFRGETDAASLPFEADTFDAVTGQYALEYTDHAATIVEIARVLRPGARGRFVLHHPDSVVMTTSREEIRHGALLFAQTRFFDKARALLAHLLAARTPEHRRELAGDPGAEAARLALNEAAATITAALESSPEPELLSIALGYARQALAGTDAAPEARMALLERGEAEVKANLARLQDLLKACVQPAEMDRIRSLMTAAGLRAAAPRIIYFNYKNSELLMGWQLDCQKVAAA